MKILHVIGQRPERTGSGIYLQAVAREASKAGHSNYMVAGVPSDTVPELSCISGDCCRYVEFESRKLQFPVTGMSDVMPYQSSLFRDLTGARLEAYKTAFSEVLQNAVNLYQPDIIHSHHLLVLTALVRKCFPEYPVVATCHGTDLRQFNNCDHLQDFVKTHNRRLDKIIALTRDQKTDIMRLYDILSENIAVIPGGYDDTLFNRTPKIFNGTAQILYAGKINRSKGVPWLLRSLAEIRYQDWHLHMAGAGKGPEYDHCMTLSAALGQKVTHHGYVSHHQLAALMKKAHIQVLPSFFEGLPLALFEGLACGCRIITTRLSGFTEIFGQVGRDTVDLMDLPPLKTIDQPYAEDEPLLEKALREKICRMIRRVKEQPDYVDQQAEKIAQAYTWPQIFQRIFSVYEDILGKGRKDSLMF